MFATFYYVDDKYVKYLQSVEKSKRGFTTVPNVTYANKTKFLYGVVMTIHLSGEIQIPYFVPVTSYIKSKPDNIILKVKDNQTGILKNVGSLRFNYMLPVPTKCLTAVDLKNKRFDEEYRLLVQQEYRYIKKQIKIARIQNMAEKTYLKVLDEKNENLRRNSNDFKLLEEAYLEYLERLKEDTDSI